MEFEQLYSVVINKATRDPYLIQSGLPFEEARVLATSWYKHWGVLFDAKVASPVVRFIVVKDGDETTFTEQSIVYRCGAA